MGKSLMVYSSGAREPRGRKSWLSGRAPRLLLFVSGQKSRNLSDPQLSSSVKTGKTLPFQGRLDDGIKCAKCLAQRSVSPSGSRY